MNLLLELSEYMCLEPDDLIRFSSTSPHRYKVYSIPKRNKKGVRIIAHPSKELKNVQRLVIKTLQDQLLIHKSAMAYKRGVNIKDNANYHVNSKYLLKMDFTNFFPSITPELFFQVLAREGISFSGDDKTFLTGILFWKPVRRGGLVLSIGAPTSPLISNSLLYRFDSEIYNLCEERNINYTRYADDLTFSTNIQGALFEIPALVQDILEKDLHGQISINEEKTVFSSKAHNRHVTGITISNEAKLSVGRKKKRNLSAAIHHFVNDRLSKEEILSLQGKIAFTIYVEPEFYTRLKKKYGELNIKNLMTYK